MRDLLFNLFNNYEVKKEDLEKVKNIVADYYKIPKSFLDKIKLGYSKLPTVYGVFVRFLGGYVQVLYKPIAKILGLYDPDKKEIQIDYSLPYSQKIKTLIHEYIHAAQDYLGKIYRLSKDKIEEEAHKVSEYLFKIYNQASQRRFSFLNYLTLI